MVPLPRGERSLKTRAGFSSLGKRLRVFEIPILAIKIFFYCYHEILDASVLYQVKNIFMLIYIFVICKL